MKKCILFICFSVITLVCSSCVDNSTGENGIENAPSLNEIVWNDYEANPILTKDNNGSPYGPYYGRILFDDNKYKMWFANGYGSDKFDIGYAESLNGLTWSIVKIRALEVGPTGSWDSYCVHPGAVIKDGNIYKMYYCGQSRPNDASDKRIGLATSTDGINWTRSTIETVNTIDIKGYTTDILKVDNTYYLYYGNSDVIGVATSTDGLNWTKNNQSVILASKVWEGTRVWSCSVIKDEDKFKMVYTTKLMNSFGYAESNDGIIWIKSEYPIFDYLRTVGTSDNIRYPFLRKVGRSYYIYYSTVSLSYENKIRVAKATY